jgi:hypothetical protein
MNPFQKLISGLAILWLFAGAYALARADAKGDDRARVLGLLSTAENAYATEAAQCLPTHLPPCDDHDSAPHQARLKDYRAAKDALAAYINKWGNVPLGIATHLPLPMAYAFS